MNSEIKKLENEFDLNFYISMNNDVAIKFNYDYDLIKDHFFKSGYQEKRLYSKIESNLFYFHDWIKYLNMNKDIVKQKVNNEVLAFKHYLEHGIHEKRNIYPKNIIKYESINIPMENKYEIIDIDFAKEMNEKFINLENNEIIHYIDSHFKNEFLLYSLNHKNLFLNYDWNQYLQEYPDLKVNKIFDTFSAIEHYIHFGSKEGRIIKPNNNLLNTYFTHHENNKTVINNVDVDNNESKKIINKNNCIYFNDKLEEEYKNLFVDFKNNILNNCNELIYEKYLIKNKEDINKIYECLCLDFDYKYYYLLNSTKYELCNNELDCLKHFFHKGIQLALPYSKNHYLLWINYDWNDYVIKHKLTNDSFEAFLDYIKNKFYLHKNLNLPNVKYPIEEFVNEFYCYIYDSESNLELKKNDILVNYNNFLKKDINKIFPNIFNYFLSIIINWKTFASLNNVNGELKMYELIHLFKNNGYDFVKYKVEFNSLINLNIPDKNTLIHLEEFNEFYYKIIQYTKNNKSIFNLSQINKQFNKLFNKNLFDIPKHFDFINVHPYANADAKSGTNINDLDLHFNFIINYINNYDELYLLLTTIFYQNYNQYKIFILNKCDDPFLEENIHKIKEKLNINNEMIIITNSELNDNLLIYNKNKNQQLNVDDINIDKELYKSNILKLKNNFKNYDINIFIDTNHYLKNNNILENICKLYNKDTFIFEKILIQTNNIDNKLKNVFMIINTNSLLNNLFLLVNYHNFVFPEKNIKLLNNYCVLNNHNYIDSGFYNVDFKLNTDFIYQLPIFILYENEENLKFMNEISNYNIIQIKNLEEFNNFIEYINLNNIYNNIILILIDKINSNFTKINFNYDLNSINNYNLINIFNNFDNKKKNIKKGSKSVFKIFNYEAMIINHEFRINYLLSNDKK